MWFPMSPCPDLGMDPSTVHNPPAERRWGEAAQLQCSKLYVATSLCLRNTQSTHVRGFAMTG